MMAFEFGQLIIRTAMQELGLHYDEKMHCDKDGMDTSLALLEHRCICPEVMTNRFS